MKEANPVENG